MIFRPNRPSWVISKFSDVHSKIRHDETKNENRYTSPIQFSKLLFDFGLFKTLDQFIMSYRFPFFLVLVRN